jgi:hypothetical protein
MMFDRLVRAVYHSAMMQRYYCMVPYALCCSTAMLFVLMRPLLLLLLSTDANCTNRLQ